MASRDLTQTQFLPDDEVLGTLKPHQFASALQELRDNADALRAIPRDVRIDAVVRICEGLLTNELGIFARLVTECAAQNGWSEAMVRLVLTDLLRLLSRPGLATLLHDELGPQSADASFASHAYRATQRLLVPPSVVVHIMAATVPTAIIEAFVLSLAAGVPVLVRASREEPITARFFVHALRHFAPELSPYVAAVTWDHNDTRFADAIQEVSPVVVVHGSDASVRAVRHALNEHVVVHGHGHRISFGVIAPDEALTQGRIEELAHDIALDAALFEGGGCMSPQTLFVLPPPAQPRLHSLLAEAIAQRAFPTLHEHLPMATPPVDVAADHMQQRGVATFVGECHEGPAGTVLLWHEPTLRSSHGYRHLHLARIRSLDDVLDALRPYQHQLSTAALFASDRARRSFAPLLAHAGVRRICPFGRMQRPVLLRAHDGLPRLRHWFQICDMEG